jgi:hypothetical protein
MRYLPAVLTLIASSGVIAGTPEQSAPRDGLWLQNGIRQYQRLNAHETVTDKEASDAMAVTSYVCAVVDLEKYLVQRADLLAGALAEGTKKKPHIDARMLNGMAQALPLLVPLMKTSFSTDSLSCDRASVIVGEYLEKYPEMLTKDAGALVDKALLASYLKTDEPEAP